MQKPVFKAIFGNLCQYEILIISETVQFTWLVLPHYFVKH